MCIQRFSPPVRRCGISPGLRSCIADIVCPPDWTAQVSSHRPVVCLRPRRVGCTKSKRVRQVIVLFSYWLFVERTFSFSSEFPGLDRVAVYRQNTARGFRPYSARG